MSFFLFRPAILFLAAIFSIFVHAEVPSSSDGGVGMIMGPDWNGTCYEGTNYATGTVVACPNQTHSTLPKGAIAGIVLAVIFVLLLLVGILLWRRRVRIVSDDSASSLFDFVSPSKRKSNRRDTAHSDSSFHPPQSPNPSLQTVVGSDSSFHEKGKESYRCSSEVEHSV